MQSERVQEVREWVTKPTTDEVEDAVQFMRQLFSFVSDRLPPETIP